MFVGTEAGPGFDEILSPVIFSTDSGHFAHVGRRASSENELINVDGHESRFYNATVGARFSDDGKSVSFVARDGGRFFE